MAVKLNSFPQDSGPHDPDRLPTLPGRQVSEPPATPAASPGWKTTEFWVTVALNVLALLVAGGVMAKETSDHLAKAIEYAALALTSIGAAYADAKYAEGRSKVKASAEIARGQIQSSQAEAEVRLLTAGRSHLPAGPDQHHSLDALRESIEHLREMVRNRN